MGFEDIGKINSTTVKKYSENQEALDDKWYDQFGKVGAFQDYEYLTGDKKYREDQKSKFLEGEIENPVLDYPDLEKFDFTEKEQELLELKKDILENEKNEVVKQLYRWKINEKLAQVRMLRNTKEGNDRKFNRYSKFIYGKPEKEIYLYTLTQIEEVVEKKLSDPDEDIRAAAERIKKQVLGLDKKETRDTILRPTEVPVMVEQKDQKEYSGEEIKKAFEEALKRYEIQGWKVILDTEGKYKAINVGQESKEVRIPEDRKLKLTQLTALIDHEIGTHVARREKGERTKLRLLGLGLDRYLKGEEGIATFREQKVEGMKDFAGFDGHLAISLAMGLDGKKHDFRQVFEILKDYFFIISKKEKSEALKNSQENAWSRCVRTFRGTTCKTEGACLSRDIVYREGNIGVWNIVKNNPQEMKRFSVGKYDPSNPRHIWILDQLGISEDDLEELEKN